MMRPGMMTALVLLPALCAAAANGLPTVTATRVSQAPVVDGILDEACWGGEPQFTDFVVAGTTGPPVEVQTRAWMVFDDDHVYFAVECDEPRMDLLLARFTDHGAPSHQDDCMEFFFQFDEESYYWFSVNTIGGHADGRFSVARGGATPGAQEWDAHFVSAASIGEDGWTLEVAFPWAIFEMSEGREAWRFNLARERWGAVREWTSWTGVFHTPSGFGRLELPGFDPSPHTFRLESIAFGALATGDNLARASIRGAAAGIAATALRMQASVTSREGTPAWNSAQAGGHALPGAARDELTASVPFHVPMGAAGQQAVHLALTLPDGRLALLRSKYFTAPEIFSARPDAPIYYTTERPAAKVQLGLGNITVRSARVKLSVDGPGGEVAATVATRLSNEPHTLPLVQADLQPGHYTLRAELTFALRGRTERIRRASVFRVIEGPFG